MRQVQIYVDVATSNININCDCVKITYQLVGEEPVTVEVESSGISSGKNYYDGILIDSKLFKLHFNGFFNFWNFYFEDDSNSPDESTCKLEENTECPFGIFDTVNLGTSGLIFESFVVSGCDLFEYKKLELFEDEQINVTSSVQNINDISKVFTDFLWFILHIRCISVKNCWSNAL